MCVKNYPDMVEQDAYAEQDRAKFSRIVSSIGPETRV